MSGSLQAAALLVYFLIAALAFTKLEGVWLKLVVALGYPVVVFATNAFLWRL